MLKFQEMLDEKLRKESSFDKRVKVYFIQLVAGLILLLFMNYKRIVPKEKKNARFFEPNDKELDILQERGLGWKGA